MRGKRRPPHSLADNIGVQCRGAPRARPVFGPSQLGWAMAALPLLAAGRTRSLYLEALARQK